MRDNLDTQYDDLSEHDRYDLAEGWEPPYQHQKLLDDYRKKNPPIHPSDNLLNVRPANEWLAETEYEPASAKLFGDLWKEGELAIMFADTGCGKSILAVQLAESIATGKTKSSPPYEGGVAAATPLLPEEGWTRSERGGGSDRVVLSDILKNTCPAQKVLYLDFELSSAQFLERYSSATVDGRRTGIYKFSDNLLRSPIDWQGDLPRAFKNYGEFMAHSINQRLDETQARVLIIDNISCLHTANTNANSALALMRYLNNVKAACGISILVLAHTPKRPIVKPLTVNDLAGSKVLANFADNLIAIGTSIRAKDQRYIKQIKPRMAAAKYDASNVIVCRLEKPDNFPQFTFLEFDDESHHTTRPYDTTNADRAKLIAAAKELSAIGHTQRDIAEILSLGKGTVGRYLADDSDAEARMQ